MATLQVLCKRQLFSYLRYTPKQWKTIIVICLGNKTMIASRCGRTKVLVKRETITFYIYINVRDLLKYWVSRWDKVAGLARMLKTGKLVHLGKDSFGSRRADLRE